MTAPRSSRGQRRPAVSAPVHQTSTQPAGEPPVFGDGSHGSIHEPADDTEIQGVELAAVRSGDDTRRRGWFWHWNSIVTQYAPLIGLKGVGLLNSYTVWTDRRESSPMRGYAFPSQQSEADFYGEDRAELIAINKILVALDLIEIKKEMVLRVDEHGHRWRVPHNLYRVKDTDDSRGLTTADVLKVTELAERDTAVYRHLRRVFSVRFSPIDPANVWHAILPEVRQDAAWQRLAAKTAREEERFSARSKAGHASRRAGAGPIPIAPAHAASSSHDDVAATGTDAARAPWDGDSPTAETTVNDTTRGGSGWPPATSVADSNDGLGPDVGGSNTALDAAATIVGPTAVGPTNRARPTGVAPSNTIEDLPTTTTTTTFGADENDGMDRSRATAPTTPHEHIVRIVRPVTDLGRVVTASVTTRIGQSQADAATDERTGADDDARISASPTVDTDAPARWLSGHPTEVGETLAGSRAPRRDVRREEVRRQDEGLALTAFEEANGGRIATPAEVRILRQLAAQIDPAAAADRDLPTGWAWIGAAVYEAVDAGSAYVAPRRIREIASRWQREGRPSATTASGHAGTAASADLPPAGMSKLTADRSGAAPSTPGAVVAAGVPARPSRRPDRSLGPMAAPAVADPGLPRPTSDDPVEDGPTLWEAVLRELARDIDPAHLAELAAEVQVARVTMDEVELTATPATAAALAGEARPRLTRALSAVLRRTVRLTIRPATAPLSTGPETSSAPETSAGPTEAGLGLTDAHLWAAVVDEVVRAGDVTVANVAAWLRPARIAGRTPAGAHVVVAPSDIARRRLDGPLRPALEAGLARVLGPGAALEITSVPRANR